MLALCLAPADKDIVLGSGNFGICYQGSWRRNGESMNVAIKALQDSRDKASFRKEIKASFHVGEHENVVKFYGISERKGNL